MSIADDRLLVTHLCDIDSGLNDWEVDFVEGIAKQVLDTNRALTTKQRIIGEMILKKGEFEDD